jgi:hypothetical protein
MLEHVSGLSARHHASDAAFDQHRRNRQGLSGADSGAAAGKI